MLNRAISGYSATTHWFLNSTPSMRHLYLNLCSSQGLLVCLFTVLPLSLLHILSVVENMQNTAMPVHYIFTVKVTPTIWLSFHVASARASTIDASTWFKYFVWIKRSHGRSARSSPPPERTYRRVEASPNRLVAMDTMEICHIYTPPRL